MASIAAGRGWSAAGQGLDSIGRLLFGLAQQRQDEEQRRAEREDEWARGAPEREARMAALLANSNLREGAVPVSVSLPDAPTVRIPADPLAPTGRGMGIGVAPPEPGGLTPEAFGKPNVTARAMAPKVAFTPDPRFEQVTSGFYRMTPEAEAMQTAALQRRLQEAEAERLAGSVGAFLENPQDARAIGGVVAAGLTPGTLRDATQPPQPRAPVPGTPEYYEHLREVEKIKDEGGGEGDSYAEQLRLQSVLMTGKALSELRRYRDETPEQFQARQEQFLLDRGFQSPAEFRTEMRKALRLGGGAEAGGGTTTSVPLPEPTFGPGMSFVDMMMGTRGGSSAATTPLTALDKEKARTDPQFQEWLRGQGYTESDWR